MTALAVVTGVTVLPGSAGEFAPIRATVYVNKHFEVRDHDQPVKYVFNGDTRVARVTGSLSTSGRVQRVRLRTGWNLISLAVTAADLLGQWQLDSAVAYRWQPASRDYARIQGGETVAAGTVLWLRAPTNLVVAVRGEYIQPTAPTIPAGGAYVRGPGLEVWPLQLPAGVTIWKYDAVAHDWKAGFADDLAPLSNLPAELAPGEAIYVHSSEAVELSIPEPSLRVAYYHQDHLGSSSVTTDAGGHLVEETAYYPFGAPRHQLRTAENFDMHYAFTQKERDREAGLDYFEARYLATPLSRFLSVDPNIRKLEALEVDELGNVLRQPAKLNPFVYALNNPARYIDPDGRDERPKPAETPATPPKPELIIRLGQPATRAGEITALSMMIDPNKRSTETTSSTANRRPAETQPFVISRHVDKASAELAHKFLTGHPMKSVTLIQPLPAEDGKVKELHITLKDVIIGNFSNSSSSSDGRPVEMFTLKAGEVTLSFVEPPPPTPQPPRGETRRRR